MNREIEDPEPSLRNAFTGYAPGDKPLLEEIGIDFSAIKKETVRVMFFRSEEETGGRDLFGPLLFFVAFGVILVARGRVQFEYLYFLSIISSLFIYGLGTLMNNVPMELLEVVHILGYAFIPTLLFSCMSMVLPVSKVVKILFGVGFGAWSMFVSTQNLTKRYQIQHKFLLLAYPIFLVYMCFVIIAVV
ncbi:protein YIPF5/7 [Nematocida sp. AWRm77]|nr:protein YIPF5/7 [Nematocida sp. AWRm77]